MELRCPKCNCTDLKKVSLAYQEGLYRTEARARLGGVVVGGDGPDLAVGRATTRGAQQSALSRALRPPVKWSYWKVGSRSALAFIALGWLVFYIHAVTTNSSTVFSPLLTLYALVSSCLFVLVLFLVWRHNHSTYARQYAEWDGSFICQRCGYVSQHGIGSGNVS